MKRFLVILVAAILTFISCERGSEPSPIKGEWVCDLNGVQMTLEYGNRDVKYTYYIDLYDATAIYKGTYTIKDNVITHEFTSLTTKNSSKIGYYDLEKMPKEAILKDDSTIIYMDYTFTRK